MMYCAERIEYFQLTKDNVDEFVEGFGKRVFRIGEPICGMNYRTHDSGIEIVKGDTFYYQTINFIPFGRFIVHNFFQNQTFVLYEEQFKQMFSVID